MVDDSRQLSDPVDRGIAQIREAQGARQVESEGWGAPKLEDVDGIGPATADKLRAAGVDHPEELARLTPTQIEMVDGIGPKRAEQLAAQFQYTQSGRFEQPNSDLEEAREFNADRSPEARRADRSFNAEITLNEEQWMSDPDHFDFPGIDTIPEQRRAERTREKAKEAGVSINQADLPGRTAGQQSGGRIDVDTGSSFDPVSTAAHEVGHAADAQLGDSSSRLSDTFFEDDDQLREEAEQLAVRRRAMATSADSIRESYHEDDYEGELFADAFAAATEEPRAAKREAPNLFRKLQDETLMDFGRF